MPAHAHICTCGCLWIHNPPASRTRAQNQRLHTCTQCGREQYRGISVSVPSTLAGGGGATISPSSSASAGPQAGTTGSIVLNLGGINLGNQDIPLNATTSGSEANEPASVGGLPSGLEQYLPLILVGVAGVLVIVYLAKRHKK